MDIIENLRQLINEKGFLIAAHRGQWGGNIIQNTVQSTELAIRSGADIVEADICRSADREYYLFHEGYEPLLFHEFERKFSEIDSAEIESMTVYNSTDDPSEYSINRLDAFLEYLPNDVLVNFDRAYFYFDDPKLFAILRASNKTNQFFLKAPPKAEYLEYYQKNGADIPFMPIVRNKKELEFYKANEQDLITIGYEVIFESLDVVATYGEQLFEYSFVMANSLHLGVNHKLAGGLTDDVALFDNEKSWKKMINAGFTGIQTDWPIFLDNYRKATFNNGTES